MTQNQVIQLFTGFATMGSSKQTMKANCSVTLVKGRNKTILFDLMTAWDGEKLLSALKDNGLSQDKIDYVVCSHGHSDHIGNLNLFLNARQFVGSSMNFKEDYFFHDFKQEPFSLDDDVDIIPTPGHTKDCVTVIVRNSNIENGSTVALVGDLFETEQDIADESLWIDAGSEDETLQRLNRLKVAELVEFIVPGHGPMFKVNEAMRKKLKKDAEG